MLQKKWLFLFYSRSFLQLHLLLLAAEVYFQFNLARQFVLFTSQQQLTATFTTVQFLKKLGPPNVKWIVSKCQIERIATPTKRDIQLIISLFLGMQSQQLSFPLLFNDIRFTTKAAFSSPAPYLTTSFLYYFMVHDLQGKSISKLGESRWSTGRNLILLPHVIKKRF